MPAAIDALRAEGTSVNLDDAATVIYPIDERNLVLDHWNTPISCWSWLLGLHKGTHMRAICALCSMWEDQQAKLELVNSAELGSCALSRLEGTRIADSKLYLVVHECRHCHASEIPRHREWRHCPESRRPSAAKRPLGASGDVPLHPTVVTVDYSYVSNWWSIAKRISSPTSPRKGTPGC